MSIHPYDNWPASLFEIPRKRKGFCQFGKMLLNLMLWNQKVLRFEYAGISSFVAVHWCVNDWVLLMKNNAVIILVYKKQLLMYWLIGHEWSLEDLKIYIILDILPQTFDIIFDLEGFIKWNIYLNICKLNFYSLTQIYSMLYFLWLSFQQNAFQSC